MAYPPLWTSILLVCLRRTLKPPPLRGILILQLLLPPLILSQPLIHHSKLPNLRTLNMFASSRKELFVTTFPTSTYTSKAHGTSGTTDHILCPEHLLPSFSDCTVLVDDPLNLSDHDPVHVCARLSCTLDVAPQQPKKFGNSH